MADCGIVASPNNTKSCSDYPQLSHLNTGGVSAQVAYDIREVTLTSITSYRKSRNPSFTDVVGIAAPIARATLGTGCFGFNCNPVASLYAGVLPNKPLDLGQTILSQEVRLASKNVTQFQWTVGGYFQRQTFDDTFPSILKLNGPICGLFGFPADSLGDCVLSDPTQTIRTVSKDAAFFANGTYDFGDATRLNTGVRYTHSDVSENNSPDVTVTPVASYSLSVPASAVTYRAALQHDFGSNTMVYGTISTGYKAPQINDQNPAHLLPVSPERPTNYEIGFKETALDGRLAVDADVYYTTVKGFQTQSCIPNPITGSIICAEVNVPRVISKGVEADIFGKPWDGMTVNVSAIYNNAKYPNNYFGADGTNLQGKQLNFAPPYKLTASFEQRFPVSSAVSLAVGADVTWRGKESMYLSAAPAFTEPAAAIFGARFGAEIDDRYSIYFFARNIANKIYPTTLLSTGDFYPGGVWQVLDPNSQRVMGIQLRARF
jgi:iron complex outermembrane receptor protein